MLNYCDIESTWEICSCIVLKKNKAGWQQFCKINCLSIGVDLTGHMVIDEIVQFHLFKTNKTKLIKYCWMVET